MLNRDRATEWLPLLTAMAEGKQIQTRLCTGEVGWENVSKVDIVYPVSYYRVAPEVVKATIWGVVNSRTGILWTQRWTEQEAKDAALMSVHDVEYQRVVKLEGSYER